MWGTKLLALIVLLSYLVASGFYNHNFHVIGSCSVGTSERVSTLHENHSPIIIDGDSEFAVHADLESWPGDGTEDTPYIISGLTIISPRTPSIKIQNTTVHFQIMNCVLNQGRFGIWLAKVKNVYIINNSIENSETGGIYVEDSKNNICLSNNVIVMPNNSGYGITIVRSWSSTLANNTVTNGRLDGISLWYTEDSTLFNNTVTNSDHGISLYYSGNSQLSNNTIINCRGIYLANSGRSSLKNNLVTNNDEHGIFLLNSGGSILIGNQVIDNNDHGIYLYNSSHCTVINNTIVRNGGEGICFKDSENITLKGNTISVSYDFPFLQIFELGIVLFFAIVPIFRHRWKD
ncbi:MAG: nitrous oxide reductase family maturation protein NosD [Candidatus Hodarchaeota archaeon]